MNIIVPIMIVIAVFASPLLQASLWLMAMSLVAMFMFLLIVVVAPILVPDNVTMILDRALAVFVYCIGGYCLIIILYEWVSNLLAKLKRK